MALSNNTNYVAKLKEHPVRKVRTKNLPGWLLSKRSCPTNKLAGISDIAAPAHMQQSRRKSDDTIRMLTAQIMSAQEQERQRISSELHDSIGQTLSAIKFHVENAIWQMNKQAIDESVRMFRNIIPKIQDAIEEVRRISMDLRPTLLDDIGVNATLTWFCREFQIIYGHIHVKLMLDIQEDCITTPLKIAIFRIVQEAMNNCAKYSQADCICVSLVNTGQSIELAIADNGQGFDPAEVQTRNIGMCGGIGLNSMQERAESSGGTFSIESAKGRCTRVRVAWTHKEIRS